MDPIASTFFFKKKTCSVYIIHASKANHLISLNQLECSSLGKTIFFSALNITSF